MAFEVSVAFAPDEFPIPPGMKLNLCEFKGGIGNFSALPIKLHPDESGRHDSNVHHSIPIRSNRCLSHHREDIEL